MAKVIDEPPEHRARCKGCGCLVGYTQSDVRTAYDTDYCDMGEGPILGTYVRCPKCGYQITLWRKGER